MARRSGVNNAGAGAKHIQPVTAHRIGYMINKTSKRKDRTKPFAVSCGCMINYPQPYPSGGDLVYCRDHDQAVTVMIIFSHDHHLACGHTVRFRPPVPAIGRPAYCPECGDLQVVQTVTKL